MKVQCSEQRLRLRVDEAELARLQRGEAVTMRTITPVGAWQSGIELIDAVEPEWRGNLAEWLIRLPQAAVAAYASQLPMRDALRFELPIDGGACLQLDFEVDVRDSVRRRGTVKRGGKTTE